MTFLQQEIPNGADDGTFVFHREMKNGIFEQIPIRTGFTQNELKDLLDLSKENGSWQNFRQIISRVNAKGSGLVRKLLRSNINVPCAASLSNKGETLTSLNYLSATLGIMNNASDPFFQDVFVGEDLEIVKGITTELCDEVSGCLENHGWEQNVRGSDRSSDSVLEYAERLVDHYATKS